MKGVVAFGVVALIALTCSAWAKHYSFKDGYPAGVTSRASQPAALTSPIKSPAKQQKVVVTNIVTATRCWALVKGDVRCMQPALKDKRYCRKHVASVKPKKTPETCRSMTQYGKPCNQKPGPGKNYCEEHLE